MKIKKTISILLSAIIATVGMTGCSGSKNESVTKDGKVRITVGNWPDENVYPEIYAEMMENKEKFEEKYSDIEIVPDSWCYDVQTFAAKAEGGTLPIIFNTHFTEAKKNHRSGIFCRYY